MTPSPPALPSGRAGQALALGVTVLGILLLYLAAVAPVLDLYAQRAELLERRQTLATHMASAAAAAEGLQRQMQGGAPEPHAALLEGATAAVAAATLQQHIQQMADQAAVRLSSAEVLPDEPAGAYRRVRVHVAVTGPWARLVGLFAAIDAASPRVLVDDLRIGTSGTLTTDAVKPLDAAFTVIALYARNGPAE